MLSAGKPKRKGKLRWGTLTAALSSVAGVVVAVATEPAVIQTVAGKIGVSAVVLGAIVSAVKKSLVRPEHER